VGVKTAVTFVAHGSRVSAANVFVRDLIGRLPAHSPVNLGFLELARPSLNQALEDHSVQGARRIRIVPLLLAPGKHLRTDIPAVIASVRKRHPVVELVLEKCLGEDPGFKTFLKRYLVGISGRDWHRRRDRCRR
jgi:sirohydrochlorin cobaltochelatase